MEPKDYIDYFKTLSFSMTAFKDLEEQIEREVARLNNIKPIYFKNPEKLNGTYPHNGDTFNVTFVGRELKLKDDNWTWVVTDVRRPNTEHTLSILKYPKLNGYATMIKHSYGQETREEIKRERLNDMEFLKSQLLSIADLPF